MNQWIDLEITNEHDLKKFMLKYETHEKYIIFYICISKAKNFKKQRGRFFKRFKDIVEINLKSYKMRLTVAKLCYKNFKLITKVSNIINGEGIIIKKR